MIAIAKIGGHQALVQAGDVIEVDKINEEVGKTVKFETLLLSEEDGSSFQIGAPTIDGVNVEAKIVEHGRGKKIRVFKMKPRKRYRRTLGHRQDYTVIEITKVGSAAAKAKADKVVPKKETTKKTTTKKPAAKKTTTAKKSTVAKAKADKPAKKVAKKTEKK